MRITLNGKRVRKGWVAWYDENQACFKKEGLKKQTVLHEVYHHLVASKEVEIAIRTEEREANIFSREFLRPVSKISL